MVENMEINKKTTANTGFALLLGLVSVWKV